MALKIIKDSNLIMRQTSKEVPLPLNDDDRKLLNEMSEYLIKSQDEEYATKHHIKAGVGLAAIQVGVLKRMFVIYYPNEKGETIHYQLVNPVIEESSIKKCALRNGEGCLSVDDEHFGYSHRYFKINMKAYDALQNKEIHIVARGFDAIVLQHEYDHLNGIFYYDRINKANPTGLLENEQLI